VPATLLEFAQVNDSAAATSKKLQKQAILAEYFRAQEESDLRLAVRFAAGRHFAATDERVLNAGWSKVSDVVLSLLKLAPHEFHDLIVRNGEIGEALSREWPRGTGFQPVLETSPAQLDRTIHDDAPHGLSSTLRLSLRLRPDGEARATGGPLSLEQIASAFDQLAATGNAERKRGILRVLFSCCIHPREAAYLAKLLFREMRSGARDGILQAAIAQAFDKGLSQIQRCQLLVGDLDEVAVIAKRDALDAATFRLFHPIQFMLATPHETAELAAETLGGRTFFAEDKLDGIRAQVHKSESRIAIYTRTMDRIDESFPDVVSALEKLPGEFLLDGEIVPYRDGQVLPFAHIQRRLGRKSLSAKMLRDNPAAFIAFDVLSLNGKLLMDEPLRVRREALSCFADCGAGAALLTTTSINVSTASEISAAFDAARARRNEGIVLKDPDSAYSPGRRGQWWLKLKTHLPTFDCVVTAVEYGHGKRRSVLSDYTFAVWDREPALEGARLVNVGKAYSGLTDAEIKRLTELFLTISLGQWGRVHVVKPQVVLEIACDQIQKSDRHDSGYALRFPRIKRIRWDKAAQDADRLERIVSLYESSPNFARSMTGAEEEPVQPSLFD
jgi:DNA ligase-1